MLRRAGSLFLLLSLLAAGLDAAPRRRAVAKPFTFDHSTPAGWLFAHATVLTSADLTPYTGDLLPLGTMIGESGVVGLGDITHGTHELYTMKLRLIDFLVRQKGFDLVAIEAPFPITNRINTYVQGGPGDVRAMLREMRTLLYPFWEAEELVAVIEWMREYNAHRGDRPAVQIAGFDVLEPYPASRSVIEYLRAVDPPAAVAAEAQYQCVTATTLAVDERCRLKAARVHKALAEREAELSARSSAAAFQEALHNARVVVQSRHPAGQSRDDSLAANVLWLREHRGSTRKMIVWAHSGHVSKASILWANIPRPMGVLLDASIGSDYFALTTLVAQGTYRHWNPVAKENAIAELPALKPEAYESYLRDARAPLLLIPLRGALPWWLTTPAPYNVVGTTSPAAVHDSLPERYDAAIFFDTTTPLREIRD